MEIPNYKEFNKNNIRENFIKTHYADFYRFVCNRYPYITFQEKLYWYFNNIEEKPKCALCGKQVKFVSFKLGYQTYCSNKCSNNSQLTKDKIRKSTEEHFGSMNNFISQMKVKMKHTCLERYGVEFASQSKEIKDKMRNTCLERYGVESYTKTDEYKEKTKQTCLERYGVESYTKTDEYKEKTKQTCLERYGVEHQSQSDVSKENYRKTCLERYGVNNFSKTHEYKEKTINTCLIRYGKSHYNNREKTINTCLERYNKKTYLGSEDCKEKTKQTCLERYGVEFMAQLECVKQKIYETKKNNNSFNKSSIEEQFASWLDENNILYIRQYKSEQYPFCCDFYFPEKDLYFEINGHCVHNNHPFNPDNKKDIATLEKWKQKGTKFYKNMIHVWTVTDPLKVKTANENNLNFKVVYSCDLNKVISEYNNVTN